MPWSTDIELVLKQIRLKSLLLSKYHKTSYFRYQKFLKYFRIPVILLSGINSVFNVALNNLIPVETVSLLCCFLSLSVGLIGSVELFLQIQKQMDLHLNNSTKYCILANDINKMMILDIENRSTDGLAFLEDCQNQFNTLMETSIITDRVVNRKLMKIETNEDDYDLLNETSFMFRLPSMKSSGNNTPHKNSQEESI